MPDIHLLFKSKLNIEQQKTVKSCIIAPMQVFRSIFHQDIAPACALTIGNFDGVHQGHQAMLSLLVQQARKQNIAATVLTFEPHPIEFFAPQKAPARITTLRDKLTVLQQCGIDQVVVLRFDQKLANLAPTEFINLLSSQGLHARYILIGDDFRFGRQRQGDYQLLRELSGQYGFTVESMNSFKQAGQRVSSSLVRQVLHDGDMQLASTLLGRPYAISGHVIYGRQLGRNLGFPTLNIRFKHQKPAASGVFVAKVTGLDNQPRAGVASLGIRPSVTSNGEVLLETHVFDWQGNAYGKLIQVELLHKLRDEMKFSGLDELKAAIANDGEQARAFWQQQNLAL